MSFFFAARGRERRRGGRPLTAAVLFFSAGGSLELFSYLELPFKGGEGEGPSRFPKFERKITRKQGLRERKREETYAASLRLRGEKERGKGDRCPLLFVGWTFSGERELGGLARSFGGFNGICFWREGKKKREEFPPINLEDARAFHPKRKKGNRTILCPFRKEKRGREGAPCPPFFTRGPITCGKGGESKPAFLSPFAVRTKKKGRRGDTRFRHSWGDSNPWHGKGKKEPFNKLSFYRLRRRKGGKKRPPHNQFPGRGGEEKESDAIILLPLQARTGKEKKNVVLSTSTPKGGTATIAFKRGKEGKYDYPSLRPVHVGRGVSLRHPLLRGGKKKGRKEKKKRGRRSKNILS